MYRENRVFVCYSTEDMDRVRVIVDQLAERSIATWFDQKDMTQGESPDTAIPPAIEQSRFFAIFLSRHAIRKIGPTPGFQKKELDQAYQIARNQPMDDFTIIPLRFEDCEDGGLGDLVQLDLFPTEEMANTLDRLGVLVLGRSGRGSPDVAERVATATALLGAGDGARAQEAIEKILSEDPQNHEALHMKACVLEAKGDLAAAIDSYSDAIASHPGFALGYANRGNAYSALEEYDKAASDFDQSIALNPNRPVPYNNRGILRRKAGDLDGALADYDRAIALAPSYVGAMVNRAILFFQRGEMEKTRGDLNRAIELEPKHLRAHLVLGQQHHSAGEFADAVAAFTRIVEINPRYREAYFHRAMVLEDRNGPGDIEAALADYDRSLRIERTANALFNRAHVLNTLGNKHEAIAAFGDVLEFDPNDGEAQSFLLQTGELQLALLKAADGDSERLKMLSHDPERVLEACRNALARGKDAN